MTISYLVLVLKGEDSDQVITPSDLQDPPDAQLIDTVDEDFHDAVSYFEFDNS